MHKKDLLAPTKAFCGAGYSWPSSIPLAKEWKDVDCPDCLKKQKEITDKLTD
jgi:hypothetical protein